MWGRGRRADERWVGLATAAYRRYFSYCDKQQFEVIVVNKSTAQSRFAVAAAD